MTQERRSCEEAGSQSCRHPAAAETACRTHTYRRACCRLHEQRPDAHFVHDKENEALHQCHRSVIWAALQQSALKHASRHIDVFKSDLISEEDMEVIAELTGCTPQHRAPSCKTTPNLNRFRTASSVCNNR